MLKCHQCCLKGARVMEKVLSGPRSSENPVRTPFTGSVAQYSGFSFLPVSNVQTSAFHGPTPIGGLLARTPVKTEDRCESKLLLICTGVLWTRPALNFLSNLAKFLQFYCKTDLLTRINQSLEKETSEHQERRSREQVYEFCPLVLGTIITSFTIWDPISYTW